VDNPPNIQFLLGIGNSFSLCLVYHHILVIVLDKPC
jgi:hypothetical protein